MSYNEIVSGLIRLKYEDDIMTSIVNNYLNDPDSEDNKSKFFIMQAWRKEAKSLANQAIQYAKENGLWEEPEDE